MKNKINEILNQYLSKYYSGNELSEKINKALETKEISLGTANGWSDHTNEIFSLFQELKKDNMRYRQSLGGRCYDRYWFFTTDGEIEIKVIWDVDSSD